MYWCLRQEVDVDKYIPLHTREEPVSPMEFDIQNAEGMSEGRRYRFGAKQEIIITLRVISLAYALKALCWWTGVLWSHILKCYFIYLRKVLQKLRDSKEQREGENNGENQRNLSSDAIFPQSPQQPGLSQVAAKNLRLHLALPRLQALDTSPTVFISALSGY